jgi:hypothetical protein
MARVSHGNGTRGMTAWNNTLLVVPKRDVTGNIKDNRVCIDDPRPLNLMFESVNFPLTIIKEIFEALYRLNVLTRIALKSAFSQFMIYLKDRHKTTFTWRGTQYHFVGAPFGFKHVPSVFQKAMNKLFSKFIWMTSLFTRPLSLNTSLTCVSCQKY